jgi:probable HAF family extracellular repeat protein
MTQSFTHSRHSLRGPRIVKTSRGIISMAAVIGAAVLLVPMSATAQDTCFPGSTGPTSGDATPYGGGMCDLGSLRDDDLGSSRDAVVSADGAVVVGKADTDDTSNRFGTSQRAFRWDSVDGMVDLGTLRTDNLGGSAAAAVSADGAVVVGKADTDDTSNSFGTSQRAFRWDTVSEEMRDLGSLRVDNLGSSFAAAVGADGAVVVGEADTDDGDARAFRWDTVSEEMRDLGSLRDDNLGISFAEAVSADGAVVVGYAETDVGSSNQRAFRWDTVSEEMRDLGSLRVDNLKSSFAFAVSADGAVVVGSADTDDGDARAFRWDTVSGEMLDLGSLRDDNLGRSFAEAVSADGAVVVGAANTDEGDIRAFIWRTQMQDLENLMLSFPVLVNDTEIAVAQQQGLVGQLANQTCLADTGASCMRTSLIGSNTGSTASDDIGSNSSLTGLISYGYGVSDGWTLGGTLSLGTTSLNNNGFDTGSDLGVALRGSYSEGHSARTGWQGEVALGYGRASGDITRGAGLDNVLLSTGQADMDTRMARASIGYGFNQAQGWLLTPTLGITNTRTTRDAYTETGGDFNASYDSLSIERTNMDLSLSAETAINDVSRLTLTGGLEHDLSADRAVLTGTSDMPGMEAFSVGSTLDRRDTRSFFAAEYAYDLSETQTLSGSLKAGQAAYGSKPQVGLGISFDMKF